MYMMHRFAIQWNVQVWNCYLSGSAYYPTKLDQLFP